MSTSTLIAPAITQERYTDNLHRLAQTKPFCPPRGPRLQFFTVAKTGAGMSGVSEYVARHALGVGRGRDSRRCT
jgi:hypothetical protein